MIKPFLQDQALLDSIRSVRPSRNTFDLWWLGQSGFLVHWDGHFLLLDPYLSDSLTIKYQDTDKPHIRMTELVIDPARLDCIDVVTSSHNHTDHLDAMTLRPLFASNPNLQLVIPEANRHFVANRLGCDPALPIGLDDGETADVGPFHIRAIPAAHNEIDRDEHGRCHYLGYIVSYGNFRIYHSGDTRWYDGLESQFQNEHIDVALLPINGHKPERRVAGNLNGTEAAQLAKTIDATLVIPCHYDMFTFNTADPAGFSAACRNLGQPHRILQCGEPWHSSELARV